VEIGERIKSERARRGISQRELARRSGVSQQGISSIESGKSSPSMDIVEMLASGLNVTVSELLFPDAEKDPPPSAGDGSREKLISLLEQVPSDQIQNAIDLLTMLKELHKRL
jgi:transcriptional regulator with XRE-family HTH domain